MTAFAPLEKKSALVPPGILAALVAIAAPLTLMRELATGSGVGLAHGWEHMAIARSLAAGRGFSNPFAFPTGPTAVLAPLHPLLLAAIIRVFGDGPAATVPMLLMEAAIHIACLVLLVRISAVVFSGTFPAWMPGLLGAIAVVVCSRPLPQWESGMAALMAEVFFLCLLRHGSGAIGAGLAAGLAWLVSPSLISLVLPAAIFLRGGRYAAKITVIGLFVTSPWLIRNALTFHAPVFLRDGFGLELFISNNDLAGPRQQDAPERYQLLHPNNNAVVAAELAQRGEPRYFSGLQTQALAWIRSHPRRFLELTAGRIRLWWAGTRAVAILSAFGIAGLWIRRREPFARAAASGLFFFSLPYCVIQFDPRYAYPALWLLALFAGYAVSRLLALATARSRWRTASHRRLPREFTTPPTRSIHGKNQ